MTVLSRGARTRRGGRRPGWLLLTVLLVLAIAASSALVFTNRVELLKLAVILALWAAVVAAFVSVIYRRQSDADQAKVRDLKLVLEGAAEFFCHQPPGDDRQEWLTGVHQFLRLVMSAASRHPRVLIAENSASSSSA